MFGNDNVWNEVNLALSVKKRKYFYFTSQEIYS